VTSAGAGPGPARLSVQVEDRTFVVEVEELGSGLLEVRVDGRRVDVDARLPASGPGSGSLLLDGVSYVVDLGEAGEDTLVAVDGETFRVQLGDPGAGRRRGPAGAVAGSGAGQRLVAPMPGKVVKVLVQVGQPVERGAGLVVLEAMKMENEFRATGSGTVREIHVEPGQAVDAGALLVVIA
jgi:biotin carboxyl carrier protein